MGYGDGGEKGKGSSYFNRNFALNTTAQITPEGILQPPPSGDIDFGNLSNLRRIDLFPLHDDKKGHRCDPHIPKYYTFIPLPLLHQAISDPPGQERYRGGSYPTLYQTI